MKNQQLITVLKRDNILLLPSDMPGLLLQIFEKGPVFFVAND